MRMGMALAVAMTLHKTQEIAVLTLFGIVKERYAHVYKEAQNV